MVPYEDGPRGPEPADPETSVTSPGLLDDLRLRPLDRWHWLVLALLTLVGAVLRVALQIDRPFVGDEIGTLQLMALSPSELLSSWQPWQTVHYFLLVEKGMVLLFGYTSVALLLFPMGLGIATIPLSGVLARTALSPNGALTVAFFTAVSPYLVEQTGVIRPYSAMTALSLATMVALAAWLGRPTWARGAAFAASTAGLVLMQPIAALPLVCIGGLVGYETLRSRVLRSNQEWPSRILRLVVPTAAAALLVGLAYQAPFQASDQRGWTEPTHVAGNLDTPLRGLSLVDVEWTWATYFASGQLAWPSLFLFLYGVMHAFRRQNALRCYVLLILASLLIFAWISPKHYPWAYSRWLTFLLPWLLLPMAGAIDHLGRRSGRRWLAPLLAALLALTWAPNLAESFRRKVDQPWDLARSVISARPNDLVVAADWETAHNLDLVRAGRPLLYLDRGRHLRQHLESTRGNNILLVLPGIEAQCGPFLVEAEELQIVEVPNLSGDLTALRHCLAATVERHEWPPSASWATIYLFLERTSSGENPALDRAYTQMRKVTEDRSPRSRHRTDSNRKALATKARLEVLSRLERQRRPRTPSS